MQPSKVLSAQLEQLYLHSLIALVFILGGWTWPSLCSLPVMFLQSKGELTSPWKWTNLLLWLYQVWGGLCIAFNFCLRNSLQCVLCSCSLLLTSGCCAWKRYCFKALKTGFSFIWGDLIRQGECPRSSLRNHGQYRHINWISMVTWILEAKIYKWSPHTFGQFNTFSKNYFIIFKSLGFQFFSPHSRIWPSWAYIAWWRQLSPPKFQLPLL